MVFICWNHTVCCSAVILPHVPNVIPISGALPIAIGEFLPATVAHIFYYWCFVCHSDWVLVDGWVSTVLGAVGFPIPQVTHGGPPPMQHEPHE